jgi:hypothetical protein
VLDSFKKAKSPRAYGLTVQFYLVFYEMIEEVFLCVVKETITSGKIFGVLNSTFKALIPKKNETDTFEYYRHISLCNVIYKIISNIIANKLKHILSGFIF